MAQGRLAGHIGTVWFFFLIFCQFAQASGLSMYERATRLVGDRYLKISEFEPSVAVSEAAESAESAIPWLIVSTEPEAGQIVLKRGDTGATAVVALPEAGVTMETLPTVLEQLESEILVLGTDLPEHTDLPVQLLRGFSRALDRHSVVMHRNRLNRFDERIKGKLVGVGAKISREDGDLMIMEVFKDSPAERGGLQAGDRILRVDEISTNGMSVSQVVKRIRGPAQSEVTLQIERVSETGEAVVEALTMTRDQVQIPNVSWVMNEDGVGLITIDHFSEQTVRLVRQAIVDLEGGTEAGLPLVGIVMDLRGNTGGSMIQAADTADLFLTDGIIVKTTGKGGKPVPNLLRMIRAHPAGDAPLEPEVPLVILQNRRSASASEIVAGALTMLDRAVIIGQTSHGKGTVQKLYVLRSGEDKVRLKLTVAEYQLSDDVPVHGAGLVPDLTVRRVVFNRSGAYIPSVLDDNVLLDVDERLGWRDGGRVDRDADPMMDLATAVLHESAGASRQAALDALDRLLPELQQAADQRVIEAFRGRDLDWSPHDEAPQVMEALVQLKFKPPVRSGERVEVEATVTNLGPAPLYRVRVRLNTGIKGRPWNGVTIPVGFLPPQERGIGTAMVALPIGTSTRDDRVGVTLEADGLDPMELDPQLVRIEGRQAPPVSVVARLVPHDDQHMVQLQLSNGGTENLTGVRARFAWQEDSGVELIDTEARVPVLAGGGTERADLQLKVLDPTAVALPLQLKVEAEQYQEVLRATIEVPTDGSDVAISPPVVAIDAPVSAPVGSLRVGISATDDSKLESLTVWWKGEKLAYGASEETKLRMEVDLPMEAGIQRLTVVARDDQGNKVRRRRYIRGVPTDEPGAAAAE